MHRRADQVVPEVGARGDTTQLVEEMQGWKPSEVLVRSVETNDALARAITGLDEAPWSLTGETPLGHVALDVVAVHAVWDSWIHERDVLLPLGIAPVEEADETAACLRYAVALS